MLVRKRMKKMMARVRNCIVYSATGISTFTVQCLCTKVLNDSFIYIYKQACHNDAGDEDEEEDEAEGGTGKRAAEEDDDEVSGFLFVCCLFHIISHNPKRVQCISNPAQLHFQDDVETKKQKTDD